MMNRGTVGLFVFVSFFTSSIGMTQEDVREKKTPISFERDLTDENGYSLVAEIEKGTNSRLGLKSSFGFNTNPYSLQQSDVSGSGSFIFKIRPSCALATKGRVVEFSLAALANAGAVFGSSQDVKFVLFNGLALGKSQLNLGDRALILADATLATSREVEDLFVASLTRLQSEGHLGLKLRPGNGVITVLAEGEAQISSYFDVDQPPIGKYTDDPAKLSNHSFYFRGKLAWEFLENEELFLDTKLGTWIGSQESLSTTTSPLWISLGVKGQIAPDVQGRLSAGYANNFIRLLASDTVLDGASLSFSMLADLRWTISQSADLFLHLSRALSPSSVFLETYTNTLEVTYRQKFAENFLLSLTPYFRLYEYGKPLAADNLGRLAGNHRNDMVLGIREELTYLILPWLSVGLSHKGKFRWSNAKEFQIFNLEGKIADIPGTFVSFTSQNEVLASASLLY